MSVMLGAGRIQKCQRVRSIEIALPTSRRTNRKCAASVFIPSVRSHEILKVPSAPGASNAGLVDQSPPNAFRF